MTEKSPYEQAEQLALIAIEASGGSARERFMRMMALGDPSAPMPLESQEEKKLRRKIIDDGTREIANLLKLRLTGDEICIFAAFKIINVEQLRQVVDTKSHQVQKQLNQVDVFQSRLRVRERKYQQLKSDAEKLPSIARSKQASNAGLAKNKELRIAREYVCSEWSKNAGEYENNKSAFARDYVRFVKQRFKDSKGDPLAVTERTIREEWLRGSRGASSPPV